MPVADATGSGLSVAEQRAVDQLRQADRAVRAHEQAHLAVGGDLVRGGPNFTYATGPDKRRYAVAGEVSIDTSPGSVPQETVSKAQHIRATALAPVDPSPQDRAVAARAAGMESQALGELAAERSVPSAQVTSRGERSAMGQVALSSLPYADTENSERSGMRVGSLLDQFA